LEKRAVVENVVAQDAIVRAQSLSFLALTELSQSVQVNGLQLAPSNERAQLTVIENKRLRLLGPG
jgi:hypothetical protein